MNFGHTAVEPIFDYKSKYFQKKSLIVVLGERDYIIEDILSDVAIIINYKARSLQQLPNSVLHEATGLFLTHNHSLTVEDLVRFRKLRIILRIGCSQDDVDVKAAGEYGVAVCNVPGYGVEEAADTTMFLILNLYRKNWQYFMEEAEPRLSPLEVHLDPRDRFRVRSIRGDTLGIVGLGRVGLAVAIRAQAFGMNVIFYDPYLPDGVEFKLGITRVSNVEDLLYHSDVVTLHCRLTCENRHIINAGRVMRMKFGAFLVNTSNGALIDKQGVQPFIKIRRIQCATLDIHQSERLAFCKAGYTSSSRVPMSLYMDARSMELRTMAAFEMRRGIIGTIPESLASCVNEEFFLYRRRPGYQGYYATFEYSPNISLFFPSSTESDDEYGEQRSLIGTETPTTVSPVPQPQSGGTRALANQRNIFGSSVRRAPYPGRLGSPPPNRFHLEIDSSTSDNGDTESTSDDMSLVCENVSGRMAPEPYDPRRYLGLSSASRRSSSTRRAGSPVPGPSSFATAYV